MDATTKAWTYKAFTELSPGSAKKAIKADRIFTNKILGAKRTDPLTDQNLYHPDGRLACMTIEERNSWFPQKKA